MVRWGQDLLQPAGSGPREPLRADQIAGKTRYSIEYGPVLLAALGEAALILFSRRARRLSRSGDTWNLFGPPLHYTLRESPAGNSCPITRFWTKVYVLSDDFGLSLKLA